MISIHEAVKSARDFANNIYEAEELKHLRVEEIELVAEDKKWIVTLGWVEPAVRQIGGFAGLANTSIEPLPRVYKTFTINADSGNVESMKIRE